MATYKPSDVRVGDYEKAAVRDAYDSLSLGLGAYNPRSEDPYGSRTLSGSHDPLTYDDLRVAQAKMMGRTPTTAAETTATTTLKAGSHAFEVTTELMNDMSILMEAAGDKTPADLVKRLIDEETERISPDIFAERIYGDPLTAYPRGRSKTTTKTWRDVDEGVEIPF